MTEVERDSSSADEKENRPLDDARAATSALAFLPVPHFPRPESDRASVRGARRRTTRATREREVPRGGGGACVIQGAVFFFIST